MLASLLLAGPAAAALNAPATLSVTGLKATGFTLKWTAATGATGGIAGYDVYRDGVLAGSTPAAKRSLTFTGLAPLTASALTVVARDGTGHVSTPSAALSVTTLADTTAPTRPSGLASAALTTTSFTLSWTASTDNVAVTGYNIYQAGVLAGTSASPSFALSGLTPDTVNRMTVRAFDAAGNLSAASAALNVRTLANPPSVPSGLNVTNLKAVSFALKWTASTDGTGGIAGYDLYRDGVLAGTTTRASYNFTGLAPLTTYVLTVVARDHAGQVSAPSAPLSVATPADTTKPSVPKNLAASAVTHVAFTLTWSPSTDNVGVLNYDVLRNNAVIGTTPAPTFPVTGLSPLTTYAMKVRSRDAAGNVSGNSVALNVTTAEVPNTPPAVTLTVPVSGTFGTVPVPVALTATATDADGTIQKVEFFDGPAKLGETAVASTPPATFTLPYTFTVPGAHRLFARATDNRNTTTDSALVSFRSLAGLPYLADFEEAEGYTAGPLQDQLGWSVATGSALVTTNEAAHGTQSIELSPGATVTLIDQEIGAGATNPSPVFVDLSIHPVAGATPGSGSLHDLDNARVAFVDNGTAGRLAALDGNGSGAGAWVSLAGDVPIDANRAAAAWHRLSARLDYSNRTWDLYLDGRLVACDLKFRYNTATYFSGLSFQGHPTMASGVDNLLAGYENPLFTDADRDGMDDAWELARGLNPALNDRNLDPDGDGLTNIEEYLLETDPQKADTDGDGVPDGWEAAHGMNPLADADAVLDADGDGASNLAEFQAGTDPQDYFNGIAPVITVLAGGAGSPGANGLVQVSVATPDGQSLPNAPPTFSITAGTSRLALLSDAGAPVTAQQSLRSAADGSATLYYRTPAGDSVAGILRVQAGGATMDLVFTAPSGGGNQPPTAALTAPAAGTVDGSFGIILTAGASDPDGTVAKVEFFADGTKLGEDTTAPYSFTWTGAPAGAHVLTVVATDNGGATTTSAPVSVTVTAGTPPLFSADFETAEGYAVGSLAGQKGWQPTYTAAAVEALADAPSGANALRVNAGSYRYHDITPEVSGGVVFIDFLAKLSLAGNAPSFSFGPLALSFAANADGTAANILTAATGGDGLSYDPTGASVALDGTRATGWHRYTLRITYSPRRVDLYVDGAMVVADQRSGFDPISYFNFSNDASQPGWLDAIKVTRSNPLFADADSDGMDDAWELAHGLDPTTNDRNNDPDNDGFTNIQEFIAGTDPMSGGVVLDSDHNGLPDAWELQYFGHLGVDPTADPDGDGLTNLQEFLAQTDPTVASSPTEDTDGNGLADVWEIRHFGHIGVDPNADSDGDGFTNGQEHALGSSPVDPSPPTVTQITWLSRNHYESATMGPGPGIPAFAEPSANYRKLTIKRTLTGSQHGDDGSHVFTATLRSLTGAQDGNNGPTWDVRSNDPNLQNYVSPFYIRTAPELFGGPGGWPTLLEQLRILYRNANALAAQPPITATSMQWSRERNSAEGSGIETFDVELANPAGNILYGTPNGTPDSPWTVGLPVASATGNLDGSHSRANAEYRLLLPQGSSAVESWFEVFTPASGGSSEYTSVQWPVNGALQSPSFMLKCLSEGTATVSPAGQLVVDANRDGQINLPIEDSSDVTSAGNPYRFWLNDDNDAGSIAVADIPGSVTPDGQQVKVQGTRDLIDYFPVFLDLKQLLTVLPPSASVKYKLKQADDGLRFVYTV